MEATWKKEARITKDNIAKDHDGGAARYGALVGRGSGCSKGQDPMAQHYCSLMSQLGTERIKIRSKLLFTT